MFVQSLSYKSSILLDRHFDPSSSSLSLFKKFAEQRQFHNKNIVILWPIKTLPVTMARNLYQSKSPGTQVLFTCAWKNLKYLEKLEEFYQYLS